MAEAPNDPRGTLGRDGESIAAGWLEAHGWRIAERNFRRRDGEIDIVAVRGGVLAFVEVKTRRSRAFGAPAEAVTRRKQARLRALGLRYLAERRPAAAAVRFDVVEVLADGKTFRVTHIENAF